MTDQQQPPAAREAPQLEQPPKKRPALATVGVVLGILVVAFLGIRLFNTLAVSPLAKAADACELPALLVLADNDKTMMLSTPGEDGHEFGDVQIEDVACVLRELDTPHSVISHIDSTRALDGQQTAEWGKVAARWTYHPSRGLGLVLTVR